jgi:hypothetical protein
MTDGFYWKFQEVDDSTFQLSLTYNAGHRLVKRLFEATINKLQKSKNIQVKGDVEVLEEFTIPNKLRRTFCPALYKAVKKNVKKVIKWVAEDGVKVMSADVFNAYYQKIEGDRWRIIVYLQGQFVKTNKYYAKVKK